MRYAKECLLTKWSQYGLLLAIVVVAAGLRLYKLGEWSFWIEELHTLRDTVALESVWQALGYSRPVYYLLSKPFFIFLDVNEWTARLPSVLIGIATVPLLYWPIRKFFGKPIAIISAILLAISPWHIYWSQNARFYTLLLLLYTASLFFFYWGMETNKIKYIIFAVIILGIAGATHPIAAFLVPIYLLYFLSLKWTNYGKPRGLRWVNLLPLLLIPLVGYVIYEVFRILVVGKNPLALEIYTRFFNESTLSFKGYASPYVTFTAVVYYIGVPLTILALVGSLLLLKRKSRIGLLISLGAFFPFLTFIVLTPFASVANRYVFMTLAFWIILGAVGVYKLYLEVNTKQPWSLLVAVGTLIGILVVIQRDPVIEDIVYYYGTYTYFLVLVLPLVIAIVLSLSLIFNLAPQGSSKLVKIVAGGVVFLYLLVAHPTMANAMYYTYQHGQRDDWRIAAIVINQEKVAGDKIVAFAPQRVAHYLKDSSVISINEITLDDLLEQQNRVWVVQDLGLDTILSGTFEKWAGDNCDLRSIQDTYTAGRLWKLRVYLCTSTNLSHLEPMK